MHRPSLAVLLLLFFVVEVHECASRLHHHQQHRNNHHHHHQTRNHHQVTTSTGSKLNGPEKIIVFDAHTGIGYNPYSKHHPGRHVCTNEKNVILPVKIQQTFTKPTYKKYTQRCHDNQICNGVKLVYETASKDVMSSKESKQVNYYCCPGWKQGSNRSYGCNKAICSNGCQNGGTCVKPDFCTCPKGFKGYSCEYDVDECKEEKPCDQICINEPGSYKCQCRENYTLQSDGQSCRRDDDEPGFEAKELQFESLDEKLHSLEVILEENKNETRHQLNLLNNNMQFISQDLDGLKMKVNNAEFYKTDINTVKHKLEGLEKKSAKIDELSARYDRMKKCAFFNKICL